MSRWDSLVSFFFVYVLFYFMPTGLLKIAWPYFPIPAVSTTELVQ